MFGWEVTQEMLRIVYLRTMGTSSPPGTGIMTRHLNAAPVPHHMGVGGGSTGRILVYIISVCKNFLAAVLKQT